MGDSASVQVCVQGAQWDLLPDTGQDCTAALQRILNANRVDAEIVLQQGRYDFFSEYAQRKTYALSNSDEDGPRVCAIVMEGMRGIVLNGNGATFVFHGQMMPFALDRCTDVVLRNLTVDWDIPLSAEGTVVSACDSWADLAIDEANFPHLVRDGRLIFQGECWEEPIWPAGHIEFDTASRTVARQRGDRFPKTRQEPLAGGRVRFWGDFRGRQPTAGNVVVLRHGRRLHAGVFVNECERITLERFTLYACGGLGILAQFSKDLHFIEVAITPNRQRGRQFVCGHDDGIHLSNDRGRVEITRCRFEGLMDDPVNLHGTAARIEQVAGPYTLVGRLMHPQSGGFPTGRRMGSASPLSAAVPLRGLARQACWITSCARRIGSAPALTGQIPAGVCAGDCMENLSNTASLTCRDTCFGGCRARGLLVSTPQRVVVEGNSFDSSGAAILIAGDASDWYESGGCEDVEIRNNTFSDACLTSLYGGGDAVITIHPNLAQPDRRRPYHRSIRVQNNLFYTSDAPILYAKSTEHLTFLENRIIRTHRYPAWNAQKSIFAFDACTKVFIQKNTLEGDVLGKSIQLARMEPADLCQDLEFPILASED